MGIIAHWSSVTVTVVGFPAEPSVGGGVVGEVQVKEGYTEIVADAGPPRLVGGPPLRGARLLGRARAVEESSRRDEVSVYIC